MLPLGERQSSPDKAYKSSRWPLPDTPADGPDHAASEGLEQDRTGTSAAARIRSRTRPATASARQISSPGKESRGTCQEAFGFREESRGTCQETFGFREESGGACQESRGGEEDYQRGKGSRGAVGSCQKDRGEEGRASQKGSRGKEIEVALGALRGPRQRLLRRLLHCSTAALKEFEQRIRLLFRALGR